VPTCLAAILNGTVQTPVSEDVQTGVVSDTAIAMINSLVQNRGRGAVTPLPTPNLQEGDSPDLSMNPAFNQELGRGGEPMMNGDDNEKSLGKGRWQPPFRAICCYDPCKPSGWACCDGVPCKRNSKLKEPVPKPELITEGSMPGGDLREMPLAMTTMKPMMKEDDNENSHGKGRLLPPKKLCCYDPCKPSGSCEFCLLFPQWVPCKQNSKPKEPVPKPEIGGAMREMKQA